MVQTSGIELLKRLKLSVSCIIIVQLLIEERLTWPVRAVLLGGGGLHGHFLVNFLYKGKGVET